MARDTILRNQSSRSMDEYWLPSRYSELILPHRSPESFHPCNSSGSQYSPSDHRVIMRLFLSWFARYLSAENVKQVRSFEFKGEDRSLFYNYFLSPLCEEIIRFIPTWVPSKTKHQIPHTAPQVHPNVLTVCGLFCNIVSHLTVLWYAVSIYLPLISSL